jgi:hypothetical protein
MKSWKESVYQLLQIMKLFPSWHLLQILDVKFEPQMDDCPRKTDVRTCMHTSKHEGKNRIRELKRPQERVYTHFQFQIRGGSGLSPSPTFGLGLGLFTK